VPNAKVPLEPVALPAKYALKQMENGNYIELYYFTNQGIADAKEVATAPSDGTYVWKQQEDGSSTIVDSAESKRGLKTDPLPDDKLSWWFTSAVSREDVLRRGRGDLHQQGDADRDAGYSWGTGAVDDEGDRCLDSSYSLGSVKAGIGVTETEVAILHLEIGAAEGQGGS